MEINKEDIEQIILQMLNEKWKDCENVNKPCFKRPFYSQANGVIQVNVPMIKTTEKDRLDTGYPKDKVYTHDLFSLEESPCLGCGIMEMEQTTFDWTLDYNEIDYVIDGTLTIIKDGTCVTAGPGEIILIPKGSKIQFSVPEKARFLYVTYPADWNSGK